MVKETFARNKPSLPTPPPPPPASMSSGFITVTAGVLNTVQVIFSGLATNDFYACLYFSFPLGTGIMKPSWSKFRLLRALIIPATPFIVTATNQYEAKFGVPQAGTKIFVRCVLVNILSGQSYKLNQIKVIPLEV